MFKDEKELQEYILNIFKENNEYNVYEGKNYTTEKDRYTGINKEVFFKKIFDINKQRITKFFKKNKNYKEEDLKNNLFKAISNVDMTNKEFIYLLQSRGNNSKYTKYNHRFPEGIDLKLIDYEKYSNNQYDVVTEVPIYNKNEKKSNRRADIVVYINGLPLIIFELKNPNNVSMKQAYKDINKQINPYWPFFKFNIFCVISGNDEGFIKFGCFNKTDEGTKLNDLKKFGFWKYVDDETKSNEDSRELESEFNNNSNSIKRKTTNKFIRGLFNKKRLIEYIKSYILFKKNNGEKIIARYHQFYATEAAFKKISNHFNKKNLIKTFGASYIFNAPGSGKTFLIILLLRKLNENPLKNNKRLSYLIVSDRKQLNKQLTDEINNIEDLGDAEKCKTSKQLKEWLKVQNGSGKIITTTVQKFQEEDQKLDEIIKQKNKENQKILFIVDEAHRTQKDNEILEKIDQDETYNKEKKHTSYYNRMKMWGKNAFFLGFTGTPIYEENLNIKDKHNATNILFKDCISEYSFSNAINDGAIIQPKYWQISYSGLKIKENKKDSKEWDKSSKIKQSEELQKRIKKIWTMNNNFLIKKIIDYIQNDFEKLESKTKENKEKEYKKEKITGMIVAPTIELAKIIFEIFKEKKPDWVKTEKIRLQFTLGKDKDSEYIINNQNLNDFKNDKNEFNIVILVRQWQTGTDIPSLCRIYLLTPYEGHTLMQLYARLTRWIPKKEIYEPQMISFIKLEKKFKKCMKIYNKNSESKWNEIIKTDKDRKKEIKKESKKLMDKLKFLLEEIKIKLDEKIFNENILNTGFNSNINYSNLIKNHEEELKNKEISFKNELSQKFGKESEKIYFLIKEKEIKKIKKLLNKIYHFYYEYKDFLNLNINGQKSIKIYWKTWWEILQKFYKKIIKKIIINNKENFKSYYFSEAELDEPEKIEMYSKKYDNKQTEQNYKTSKNIIYKEEAPSENTFFNQKQDKSLDLNSTNDLMIKNIFSTTNKNDEEIENILKGAFNNFFKKNIDNKIKYDFVNKYKEELFNKYNIKWMNGNKEAIKIMKPKSEIEKKWFNKVHEPFMNFVKKHQNILITDEEKIVYILNNQREKWLIK